MRHNNHRELWQDLDRLECQGDFVVTDLQNASIYVSKYKAMVAREYRYELNIRCINIDGYESLIVLVQDIPALSIRRTAQDSEINKLLKGLK